MYRYYDVQEIFLNFAGLNHIQHFMNSSLMTKSKIKINYTLSCTVFAKPTRKTCL